jgi:hypothetical protein
VLAKLYQSTNRPADAYAVLTLAPEGFSPTPEMPEIAEAQALLEALAQTEESGRRGSTPAAAASTNRLRQRAHCDARPRRAGGDRSLRRSPRTAGGRLRPVGGQLGAGRVAADKGSPSSATLRQYPIPRRLVSLTAQLGSRIGSLESTAKGKLIWYLRSPRSDPAAMTIWRYASEQMPASWQ